MLRENALAGHAVDLGDDLGEGGLRGGLVARLDGLEHGLDRGADAGAQRHVVRTTLDGLTCALLCRLNIGQGFVRRGWSPGKGRHYSDRFRSSQAAYASVLSHFGGPT